VTAIAQLPVTTADQRAPFLAAIVARPDDDLLRLIFADWLDEHGDADRAAFIRLQCAEWRGDSDAGARAAKLERAHRREWLAELPEVYHAEFRRGFAEHLVVDAATFVNAGANLRRRTPVRSVALVGAGHMLEQLLSGHLLDGLPGLHLNHAFLNDDGLVRLADAPCLRELRTLRLAQTGGGDAGVAALARSPHFTRLRTLVLSGNAVGDAGAWDLAGSRTLRGLKHLEVADNEIGPSGTAALRAAFAHVNVSGQRESGRWWRAAAAK
jgi:uncharacterized protein (TIGR02996 family)